MKRTRGAIALVAVLGVGFGLTLAHAGNVSNQTDGKMVWQAGIDGVEIEWDSGGSLSRIYSRETHDVRFPDRAGIRKAQVIAEEKAKAAIIRFINQSVSSTRLVSELDSDLQKATRTQEDGGADSISKVDERTMIESLAEVTSSWASGNLRGVILLEKGYDEENEVAWVKVGVSRKTMNVARALGSSFSEKTATSGKSKSNSSVRRPGTEVQRSRMSDW